MSFITGPFTLAPGEYFSDPHTNYWVCPEIARLFLERGYDVDVINWDDNHFIPRKKYAACIDTQQNLERLSPFLGSGCVKIMHITGALPSFQNQAEQTRLKALEKRRGVSLAEKRKIKDSNNQKYADFIEGYGNQIIHDTYRAFGKKIISIPIPSMETYDFPTHKDFATTRKNFLWFGGGGAILKGLDLVIETFASLPHLNLSIVGPATFEKGFRELYAKELNLPNITHYGRPRITKNGEIKTGDRNFLDIINECAAIIYPSSSEGTSGSVVQAMHAGLVPIVTPETGIDPEAGGIIIKNPDPESLRDTVLSFSNLIPEKIKSMAITSWSYAQTHYTKAEFTKKYASFIDTVLKL